MKNIEMKVEGEILTVRIDLTKDFGESRTGKTRIVASTVGNKPVEGKPGIYVGVNCFKKK